MTREQKLLRRVDQTENWFIFFVISFVVGSVIYYLGGKDKEWAMLIVPLYFIFDSVVTHAMLKNQLYTLRLLGKQNEPADNAEDF